MGLSCILLCVVFSEQYFAHVHLWYVWQYVVCVVHRVDAACVVPTVIIITVDPAWSSITSLPQTKQGYSRLTCGPGFGWQSAEFNITSVHKIPNSIYLLWRTSVTNVQCFFLVSINMLEWISFIFVEAHRLRALTC